jgi:hypothetical protein
MWSFGGGQALRVSAVDDYVFPGSVVERFGTQHPEVHPEDVALVEAAARQWFRLFARKPRSSLALPSRAVSDLWLSFVHAEDAYRLFCQDAFGAFLPHRPPPSGPDEGVADGMGLQRTLTAARQDEPDAPSGLPSLFRVDATVQILNARRYIPACGGEAECYVASGAVCLKHVGSDRLDRRAFDPRRQRLNIHSERKASTPPKNPPSFGSGGTG